jgi:hypothetical protein
MSSNTIKVGKYTFTITEDIMKYGDRIISHTFKIGGKYDNCIGISYTYSNNVPVSAIIVFVQYEPECSFDIDLEKNGGTAIMLKTILKYVYTKIPSVYKFILDDMSHIDCAEKDLTLPPPRKNIEPLNLAYLSIAYNSATWYEKNFGAVLADQDLYRRYRDKLSFLTNPSDKLDFVKFLEITKLPKILIEPLEKIYNASKTYREFFKSIPLEHRCEMLRPWLNTFIEYYIRSVYKTNDWVIDIRSDKFNRITGGSKSKTRKRNKKDYSSNYRIVMYNNIHTMG